MYEFVNFIVETVSSWGYLGIFLMMTIESSFIPFPSEVAMIPAGYLSSIGQMNFTLALLSGTFWAIFWSTINYFLWLYFWEKVIKKMVKEYWKYVFISIESYEKTEKYFQKHWSITTFTWRLIPAVRQLISIPAGIFKMDLGRFFLYTSLWAWLWNLILMIIGYIAWENKELIKQYSSEVTIGLVIFLVVLIWAYVSLQSKKSKLWR